MLSRATTSLLALASTSGSQLAHECARAATSVLARSYHKNVSSRHSLPLPAPVCAAGGDPVVQCVPQGTEEGEPRPGRGSGESPQWRAPVGRRLPAACPPPDAALTS